MPYGVEPTPPPVPRLPSATGVVVGRSSKAPAPPQSARTARAASRVSHRERLNSSRRPATARGPHREGAKHATATTFYYSEINEFALPFLAGDSGPLRHYQKPEATITPVEGWVSAFVLPQLSERERPDPFLSSFLSFHQRGGPTFTAKDLTPWRKDNWSTGW